MTVRVKIEGAEVQLESTAEAASFLKALGIVGRSSQSNHHSINHGAGEQAADKPSPGGWDAASAQSLYERLREQSREALLYLVRRGGTASTREIAQSLKLKDNKGVGPILAAFGKQSREINRPHPYDKRKTDRNTTSITLSQEFRDAAKDAGIGQP